MLDIDQLAAEMCYLQLSLLHIPAEIVLGNTLSLEVRSVVRMPAHYLEFWDSKLASKETPQGQSLAKVDVIDVSMKKKPVQEATITDIQQFGFDF